jgi:hypothetical protein
MISYYSKHHVDIMLDSSMLLLEIAATIDCHRATVKQLVKACISRRS